MKFSRGLNFWKALLALGLLGGGLPSAAGALDFGVNKVRYHDHRQWHVIETDHFEVYYYDPCLKLAQVAAQDCEAAFLRTSRMFNYVPQPQNKIPLFVYGTPLEFAETNITEGFLDQGVGGFTEVFKNRIAVPMDGSFYEFNKVITHELTHAFQYDLIYGEGWRSINLFKSVLVPTWMMEGMAEWNAQHLDGQGEMVLRDAVLNDEVLPLGLLNSFGHFPQVYTAYKESQSILDYISQVYGADKVPEMLKRMANNQSADAVIKALFGISEDELYDRWHFYMRTQAWSRIQGMPQPEKYGEPLEEGIGKSAASPDGHWVATLTQEHLGLIDPLTKEKKGLKDDHFNTRGSGLAWSPDSQFLAYTVTREGENRLVILKVPTGQTRELKFPNLPSLFSPAWSIDQRYLIFSGYDYFSTDLYRLEIATGKLDRLTESQATKSWAQYGPDGQVIDFLQEEGGSTSIAQIKLGSDGLPQGECQTLAGDLEGATALRVAGDGLYVASNRDKKIFNLYRLDPTGKGLTQLTHTFTDVVSFSISPDGASFYVSLYQKGKESLYRFNRGSFDPTAVTGPPAAFFLGNHFDQVAQVIPAATLPASLAFPDGKAPGAPTTAGSVKPDPVTQVEVEQATNLVQLHWTVSQRDDAPVDDYRVYRATAPGAPFAFAGKTANGNDNRFNDFEVEAGTHYFYYVTAENAGGESGPSPVVDAVPKTQTHSYDYGLKITPDILLFLAGYDSSFGFVGGGVVQMSDYLGNHRFSLAGNSIPTVQTGLQLGYEFSQWRITVDFDLYYYQNFLQIYDLQSGNLVNQYRDNENGFDLNFTYPFDTSTRLEY
ncbi:MAG TPA: hypothetical protein VMU88_07560, partial [bacterium]|nr:hypothetical protein [bacterium]